MTESTTPQLTESEVGEIERKAQLILPDDSEVFLLIRDWRALRAASEWQKSTIENLTVGVTGCAERLAATRQQGYEEGFEAGTAFAQSVVGDLQSENAALREQLAGEKERADSNFAAYDRIKTLYSDAVNQLKEARAAAFKEARRKVYMTPGSTSVDPAVRKGFAAGINVAIEAIAALEAATTKQPTEVKEGDDG